MFGTPTEDKWKEGYDLSNKFKIKIPKYEREGFPRKLMAASPELLDLLSQMLNFNSADRPSADDILNHPFVLR